MSPTQDARTIAVAAPEALRSIPSLDAIFGALTDGVTIQSATGLVYANPAAIAAMGFAGPDALMHASSAERAGAWLLFDESGAPLAMSDLPGRRVLEGAARAERIIRYIIRKTGEERWALVKSTPLREEAGHAGLALNVIEDLTLKRQDERRRLVQQSVTAIVARAQTLDDALPQLLAALGEGLGWDVGSLWRGENGLRCIATWRAPSCNATRFERETRAAQFAPGEGLPGRVASTRAAEWVHDFPADNRHPRAAAAKDGGLHSAIAIPLRAGGRVVGVLEFACVALREPDVSLLALLETVGGQVGLFLERADADAAVRESNARRGAILDCSLDCIITIDAEGRILDWNLAAERTFGYARAEAVGQPMADLIVPPELRDAHRRGIRRYLETGDPRVLGKRLELPALRRDGGTFPAELAIVRVPDAQPPLFTGFLRDITTQKQQAAALHESQERLAKFHEGLPLALFATTPSGQFLDANMAFARLVGYADVADLTATRSTSLYADSHEREKVMEILNREGAVHGFETCFIHRDGSRVRVSISARTIRDPHGHALRYEGAIEDITDRKRAEEELRFQAALLESQMESVPDAVLVVGLDGTMVSWNGRFQELWGIPGDVLARRDVAAARALAVEKVRDAEQFLQGLAYYHERSTEICRDEVAFRDGRVFERYGAPVRLSEGTTVGRIWTYRDVTSQRASAEKLRRLLAEVDAQRARLDNIVRSVPGVVWERWSVPGEGRTDFVSGHVEPMLGFTSEAFTAVAGFWLARVHPDERARVAAEAASQQEAGGGTQEFRWQRRDGRYVWTQTWNATIRDATGAPMGLRGVTIDATERHRHIALLSWQRRVLESIASGAPVSATLDLLCREAEAFTEDRIYTVLRVVDGKLRHGAGPSMPPHYNEAIDGLVIGDGVGSCGTAAFRGETIIVEDIATSPWWEPFRGLALPLGLRACWSTPIVGFDGAILGTWAVYARAPGTPTPDDEAVVAIARRLSAIAIERDLAEKEQRAFATQMQSRAEQLARVASALERSNRELDQFAYVASHDLKAPLRGIANLSRWIEEDMDAAVNDTVRAHLELMRVRVNRMDALIDAVLEYSRVGRVRAKPERVETRVLVEEVVDLLSPPPGFSVAPSPELPAVDAERMRLQQVFLNLIGNAIKHHPDRERGHVWIDARDEGDVWRFEVRDDGRGIAKRFHEKVFVIFQTLEARDKVEGTGIGLALVKKIVEAQGGSVGVDSKEGAGATFWFTWPKSYGVE